MSTEDEFTQYKRMYEELQQRVSRLSLYQHLFEEVQARLRNLNEQVDDFPGLEEFRAELEALASSQDEMHIEHEEQTCTRCGEKFLTHIDAKLCPRCQD